MPVCEIVSTKNVITSDEKASIAEKLTPILLAAEGLENNSQGRSICLISFTESSEMFLGGVLSDTGKIVVKISVFAEAYSDAIKRDLFQDIKAVFEKENRVSRECEGNNIWCIIQPVYENNFGVAGTSISLEMTKAFVNTTRSEK